MNNDIRDGGKRRFIQSRPKKNRNYSSIIDGKPHGYALKPTDQLVRVQCLVDAETERAYKVNGMFVPMSMVARVHKRNGWIEALTVAKWAARKAGLA